MAVRPNLSAETGSLRQPLTSPGAALLTLLAPHLPAIRNVAGEHDQAGSFPAEVFEALRKDGVLGATAPTEFGGLGVRSLHDVALALKTVAEADASTALALHMQLSRGLTLGYEWQHGSPAARSLAGRLLRLMGSGEAVVCTTVKDAQPGRTITRLTPAAAGEWLLTGQKMLASLAPVATHFVISARAETDGRPARQAAAMVARQTPGLTVLDNWDGLGMRASGSVDVVLDGCRVPEADIFFRGPVGQQDDAALAGQTVSSITMLGIYVGVAGAARDITLELLGRRRTPPPGAVRTLIAEIDAQLFSVRAAAAAAIAEADRLAYADGGDPAERGRRMMTPFQCAKLVVNRLTPQIVGDCLTIVGGASYTATHPLARRFRDARAGAFMHPYTYADAVDYLSSQALATGRDGRREDDR
ncbi:acyl-CoA dehydrogenase family protein [Micromonospora sp. NPDC049559]|uniref:acyl-CoA dehydrogenase family protein n=1 Tax=Micromonospora sp. NPDC049559 TaxID=3155923 RepID=UPI00344259CE